MSELAEGARLEIVCAAKSGTEGSNPSLSAIRKIFNGSYMHISRKLNTWQLLSSNNLKLHIPHVISCSCTQVPSANL